MPNQRLTDAQLAEIEARCVTATEGPWRVLIGGYLIKSKHDVRYPEGQCEIIIADTINYNNPSFAPIAKLNASFIAHTREGVPALLAEVRRLRAGFKSILDFQSYASNDPVFAKLRQQKDAVYAEVRDCPECQHVKKRKWPPSGVCDHHYREIKSITQQLRRHEESLDYSYPRDVARRMLKGNLI